jgi:hypothetical protein
LGHAAFALSLSTACAPRGATSDLNMTSRRSAQGKAADVLAIGADSLSATAEALVHFSLLSALLHQE